jgi:hypothetical protein
MSPLIKDRLLPQLGFLHLDLNQLIAFFRSLLSAVAAWLIYLNLKNPLIEHKSDLPT